MTRLVSRAVFELAVHLAPEQLRNVAAGGYRIGREAGYALGVQEGRRRGLRAFFPTATDAQLDRILALKGSEN